MSMEPAIEWNSVHVSSQSVLVNIRPVDDRHRMTDTLDVKVKSFTELAKEFNDDLLRT
jgi:hypothetical protein